MGPVEREFFNKTGKRHLFNITAIENISSILKKGIVCYNSARKVLHCSIAMDEVQKRRSEVRIPNGRLLHQYANLYFDYHNPMLYKRKDIADTLCILAISASVLDLRECVVSDRNASSKYASFYTALEGMQYLDFPTIYAKNWTHPDEYEYYSRKSIKCAEALIPFSISSDYIDGAYVMNSNAEKILLDSGFNRKIVINPAVFYH